MLAKVVVNASPLMEIEYEIPQTGERRRLRTPPYKHGFVVNPLHGIEKCAAERFAILASREVWTRNKTVNVADWLKQPIFEVDGLVYDLAMTIKTVADKEGAHIDQVVDSEGIYTGNRTSGAGPPSNAEAYVRSRLVKFEPFTYPHIVVFCVARYLVTISKASLTVKLRPSPIPLSANEPHPRHAGGDSGAVGDHQGVPEYRKDRRARATRNAGAAGDEATNRSGA